MPLLPPVTRTVFPLKRFMTFSFERGSVYEKQCAPPATLCRATLPTNTFDAVAHVFAPGARKSPARLCAAAHTSSLNPRDAPPRVSCGLSSAFSRLTFHHI